MYSIINIQLLLDRNISTVNVTGFSLSSLACFSLPAHHSSYCVCQNFLNTSRLLLWFIASGDWTEAEQYIHERRHVGVFEQRSFVEFFLSLMVYRQMLLTKMTM